MMMLLIAIFRYHLRLYRDERIVGRLVWADPIFIWWPHVVTATLYTIVSLGLGLGLFQVLRYFV
jgi:cell division protein FtsX